MSLGTESRSSMSIALLYVLIVVIIVIENASFNFKFVAGFYISAVARYDYIGNIVAAVFRAGQSLSRPLLSCPGWRFAGSS